MHLSVGGIGGDPPCLVASSVRCNGLPPCSRSAWTVGQPPCAGASSEERQAPSTTSGHAWTVGQPPRVGAGVVHRQSRHEHWGCLGRPAQSLGDRDPSRPCLTSCSLWLVGRGLELHLHHVRCSDRVRCSSSALRWSTSARHFSGHARWMTGDGQRLPTAAAACRAVRSGDQERRRAGEQGAPFHR